MYIIDVLYIANSVLCENTKGGGEIINEILRKHENHVFNEIFNEIV